MTTKAQKVDLVLQFFADRPTKEVAYICECTPQHVERIAYALGLRKSAKARANAPYVRFERWYHA